MDTQTHEYHSYVTTALESLIAGLAPFVERVLTAALPQGLDWTSVIERKDKLNGIRNRRYSRRDLSLLLRVLTERLGDLGFPFDRELPRQGQNLASELREVRNRWAHNEEFDARQTYRALDSAELLLRMVSAGPEARVIAQMKALVLPTTVENEQTAKAHQGDSPLGHPVEASADVLVNGVLPVVVKIRSVTMLSYAMAHCRIPIIDQITVENNGPECRGASVEIDVTCALGALADKKILLVDLAENGSAVLNRPELQLDPARMLLVEVQRPGIIDVTVRDHSGVVLGKSRTDVQVLASSQWVAQPLVLGLELLTAYVQPNAPVISEIVLSASDLLKQHTGNSALDAYQSDDPTRVDAIVEAIYDTFRSRDIRYAEPPASWGEIGQKVRTPEEVLEGRLGTCLDTTVTLAAALELVGINSTLWLLQGHIFLGYWRIDDHLGVITNTDVVEIVNRVDLDHIGLVETTMMTGGDQSKPFSKARRSPVLNSLHGDLSQFFGITDIRQARQGGIYPLPSRLIGADGTVEVSYYQPADRVVIPDYEAHTPKRSSNSINPVPPRVSAWKNALLDLSLRNRLINFTDSSGFPLSVPARAVARLEDVVNDGLGVTLLPSDAVSNVQKARGVRYGRDLPEEERELLVAEKHAAYIEITQAAYTPRLRYLAYKAKTIVEETGANNLYLTFGMLKWRFNDRELRSPLFLVPVTLASANRGTSYRISLDEAGSSTPNYCLIEKLRVSFGLEIRGLANPVEDSSGVDLAAAFTAVREAIAQAGLPFRVEESVQLSVLQFAKFRLWKDLDENWQALSENSLVRHLIETPLEGYVDPVAKVTAVDLDELGLACPVPADSSQLEAVADAVGGKTFVLEGPPGHR